MKTLDFDTARARLHNTIDTEAEGWAMFECDGRWQLQRDDGLHQPVIPLRCVKRKDLEDLCIQLGNLQGVAAKMLEGK